MASMFSRGAALCALGSVTAAATAAFCGMKAPPLTMTCDRSLVPRRSALIERTAFCAAGNDADAAGHDVGSGVSYDDVAAIAYALLACDTDYEECGQVSRDEVDLTVGAHAFTQIGILEKEGVRALVKELGGPDGRAFARDDVFVDVGSGVGNIALQVFTETDVRRSIGVELLPSRHKWAEFASGLTRVFFAQLFEGGRDIEFVQSDFTDARCDTVFRDATIVFSHSWMFDAELMRKFGDRVVKDGTGVKYVISSRTVPQLEAAASWSSKLVHLQADWNADAPFYIYERRAQ